LRQNLFMEATKYYAFDWDDNIMKMPTTIILMDENDNEVGMSTEDFAHYRTMVGNKKFKYKNKKIVGFAKNPFRMFTTEGDNQFLTDIMSAPTVDNVWCDFVEAINSGSIFSIITARGHNPNTLKRGVRNLIKTNRNGLSEVKLVNSLKRYREKCGLQADKDNNWLINDYLNKCKFYPVSFGEGSAVNPEQGKIFAMTEFIAYVNSISYRYQKSNFRLKNNVNNKFVFKEPLIGFSDDDIKNIKTMNEYFNKDEKVLNIYFTKGNNKLSY